MATLASVVASGITVPTQFGRYLLQPNTTYTAAYLDFSSIYVIIGIAKNQLVFNDGTNSNAAFVANPTVAQLIQAWNYFHTDSVAGASGQQFPNTNPPTY